MCFCISDQRSSMRFLQALATLLHCMSTSRRSLQAPLQLGVSTPKRPTTSSTESVPVQRSQTAPVSVPSPGKAGGKKRKLSSASTQPAPTRPTRTSSRLQQQKKGKKAPAKSSKSAGAKKGTKRKGSTASTSTSSDSKDKGHSKRAKKKGGKDAKSKSANAATDASSKKNGDDGDAQKEQMNTANVPNFSQRISNFVRFFAQCFVSIDWDIRAASSQM